MLLQKQHKMFFKDQGSIQKDKKSMDFFIDQT